MPRKMLSETGETYKATEADTQIGTKQMTLFLSVVLIEEAKEEARRLSVDGLRVKYTDVIRVALEKGMKEVKRGGASPKKRDARKRSN